MLNLFSHKGKKFLSKKFSHEVKTDIQESVRDESLNAEQLTIDDIAPIAEAITRTAQDINYDPNYLLNSPHVLGWASEEEQIGLCNVVTAYIQPHQSILDVGCGRGDMFSIIQDRFPKELLIHMYTGIDFNPNIIHVGKEKYPGTKLITSDLFSYESDRKYDWVVANGTFNYRLPNDATHTYLLNAIDKMFSMCNVGVAFNVLTEYYDENDKDTIEQLYKHDFVKILQDIREKYLHVILRTDYMTGDATFYILNKS